VRVARVTADCALLPEFHPGCLAWLHEEICRCAHCKGGGAEAEWT